MRKPSYLAAALVAALAGVALPAAPALAASPAPSDSVSQLEQELAQDQARLAQLNNQVETANAALDALDRKLQADQQRQAELDRQLAQLARLEYQRPVFTLNAVLGARSLQQLLSNLAQARVVANRQGQLLREAARLRQEDQRARDQMAARVAQIKAARDQAAQMAAQVAAELGSVQSTGLASRVQAVAAQARATATGVGAPSGPWPNHFAYGYCTWYVANHVYVPWFGNAIEWWPNARPYYPEGQTPRVGAIMVTRESGYGHVALVVAVHADGSWTVSEMNYQAWGVVDQRTIRPGQVPLVGFIYPPPQDER
jgi:surface antigen